MKIITSAFVFLSAQIVAWFQTNSVLLGGRLADNFLYVAIFLGPITSILFAYGTKMLYQELGSLWSIRFLTFGLGYLVFIPLTWYFLGEEILTLKNTISFFLCVALMAIQIIME
jgi:hypothetical protein